MSSNTIRIVIADDHEGIRQGIRGLLRPQESFEVVGEASNGKEAITQVKEYAPDILLLDVEMPVLSGPEAARRITEEEHKVKILALSSYHNPEYILDMFNNGACGYLTKEEAPKFLQKALMDIYAGSRRWLSDTLIEKVGVEALMDTKKDVTLTASEIKVIQLLKSGMDTKAIAKEMNLEVQRVNRYLKVLVGKLDLNSIDGLKDFSLKTG